MIKALTIYYDNIKQNSEAWDNIRAGKLTASQAAKVMGRLNTKGLSDLCKSVAWGRVYGHPDEPHYMSSAMLRGHKLEEEARHWYEKETGNEVELTGFAQLDHLPNLGWSPDGLTRKRKVGVEIKCLLHKAYIDVKRTGKIPSEYRWQCRWGNWIGGLDRMDFVAYHPDAGGIIIPATVTEEETSQMRERVVEVERMIQENIRIIKS